MTLEEQILNVMHDKFKLTYQIKEIFEGYYGADKIDIQVCPDRTNPTRVNISWEKFMLDKICDVMLNRYKITAASNLSREDMNIADNTIRYVVDHAVNGVLLTVIVYFPRVRIENEHKRWHMIEKLFVSVPFFPITGHLHSRFYYTRSKYTIREVIGNYMHSHVSGTNLSNPASFLNVCTGSGPINGTMHRLENEFNEELWTLFCWELDKAVHVESLAGGPYMFLERIGDSNGQYETHVANLNILKYDVVRFSARCRRIINDFLKEFLREKRLKFKYVNHNYVLGMLYKDYVMEISNSFIEWVNNHICSQTYCNSTDDVERQQLTFNNLVGYYRMISKVVVKGDKIYEVNENVNNNSTRYRGRYVLNFKGNEQNLEIIGSTDEGNDSYVLNADICNYILDRILKFVNRNYGKNKIETTKDVKYL